jgi:heme-degrading monooxygenase HmoA
VLVFAGAGPLVVDVDGPEPGQERCSTTPPTHEEERMAAILFVRVRSELDFEELERRLAERRPRFRQVPGLIQKIYARDPTTGDVCGIYFFESQEALAAYRETELARTIPTAYEAADVRLEAYELLYPLWPGRGPFDPAAVAAPAR